VIESTLLQRCLGRTRPPSIAARPFANAHRAVAMSAAVAVLLLAVPKGAAGTGFQAVEPPPIRLRAVTTVAGTEAGSVSVYLSKDVDVNGRWEGQVDPRPPYDFRGKGRLTAVLLTEDSEDHALGDGASLLSWTFGKCLKKGCAPRGEQHLQYVKTFGPLEERDDKYFLPKGKYRLYFVADGVWAKFRMELEGLSGRTHIKASAPVTSQVRSLRPQPAAEGGGGTYWQGKSADLSGRGLSLTGLWLDGDGEAVRGEGGFCAYDEKPADEGTAYMPPCPEADAQQSFPLQGVSTERTYFPEDLVIDQGMGAYYTTASALKRVGGTALWFEF
jgi:hypothetical protein